jgi:hypothetical protein
MMRWCIGQDGFVEVFSIVAKVPTIHEYPPGIDSYVLRHERFERLSYILKPFVYLSFISGEVAYLGESDPNDNFYDTRKYPFFFVACKVAAKKVIAMNLDLFVKMSEDIGEPKCDVNWIFHTGRCSSTALAQALNASEGVTVISEPTPLLGYLSERCFESRCAIKDLHKKTIRKLALACFNFILKDFTAGEKVCIKTPMTCQYEVLLPLIAEKYPDHKIISMYRDGVGVAKSVYRVNTATIPSFIQKLREFSKNLPRVFQKSLFLYQFAYSSGMIQEEKELLTEHRDHFLINFSMWIGNMVHFRANAPSAKHLMTLSFDDFYAGRREANQKVGYSNDIMSQYQYRSVI